MFQLGRDQLVVLSDTYAEFARDDKNLARKLISKLNTALPGFINTNLGRLDYPVTYGDLSVEEFYFIPPGVPGKPLVLGAVGFQGTITLAINYIAEGGDPVPEVLRKLEATVRDGLQLMGLSPEGGLMIQRARA